MILEYVYPSTFPEKNSCLKNNLFSQYIIVSDILHHVSYKQLSLIPIICRILVGIIGDSIEVKFERSLLLNNAQHRFQCTWFG